MRGIYKITCLINLKCYIGKSENIENRLKQHKSHLTYNKHINLDLQSDFNKYGIDNFKFETLFKVEKYLDIDYFESFYAEKFYTFTSGYNIGFLHQSSDIEFINNNLDKLQDDFINKIIFPLDNIIKNEKLGIQFSINLLLPKLEISYPQAQILIHKLNIKDYFISVQFDIISISYHDLDNIKLPVHLI